MQNDVEKKSETKLQSIVITGASGFIGRNFVDAIVNNYRLFCIARRSQNEAGIPKHKNILWTQADIGNSNAIKEIAESIKKLGGADFVVHLAGFYDFTLKDGSEYQNTNINGTKNILDLAKSLNVKRFLFSSSLAACKFSDSYDKLVDEKSPADAEYLYAVTKKAGENMTTEYSKSFPCSIIRFAAVYSDWCEYPPLFMFLNTWLSKKWNSKIIGGKGESSITYIHINDLIKIFLRIIEKTENLPEIDTYIASQGGTVSHNDLYREATKYFYGHSIKSIHIPKFLALPGVIIRSLLGKILGNEPFEKLWMMQYIDKKLIVENSYTRKKLSWSTAPRYDVLRRIIFMVEKMKNNPAEWNFKNEAILDKVAYRQNVIAYDILIEQRKIIVDKMVVYIVLSPDNKMLFPHYRKLNIIELKWFVTLFFQLIAITIKTKDRQLIRNYAKLMTCRRFIEGFDFKEIVDFVFTLIDIIKNILLTKIESKKNKQEIYDYINIATQLTVDEIEEYYEFLQTQDIEVLRENNKALSFTNMEEIENIINNLGDTFFDSLEHQLSNNISDSQTNNLVSF
ncbi:MAG: NAD(P)-dependent oxidoreductase, partial [Bacteroidota bacterium]